MRLFLHGRLESSMMLERLEQARNGTTCYSSLLLSNWNVDEMDADILHALEEYLNYQQELHRQQQQEQHRRQWCIQASKNSTSFQHEQNKKKTQQLREIILYNCTGGQRLQHLVALSLDTTAQADESSITIRYDKQRKLSLAIANGLLEGAKRQCALSCPLKSLILKGMTLTPETTDRLHQALAHLPNLQELTIRGIFTLQELDRKHVSILGKHGTRQQMHDIECTVDLLYDILQGLPQLKLLDLQHCHLPDQYLADLLEGLYPETLQTLRLRGNMCMEESQEMVYDLLMHKQCALQELDLSWQRLPQASRNYSILHLDLLSKALVERNTSLQRLNLSDNRLPDEDVSLLAVALLRNTFLTTVRLQNCRITSRGFLALAQTLPMWSENMKSIQIDGSQKVEKASLVRKRFFQALLKNVYLQQLDLPDSCQSKSMDWVLELNRAGRRALLAPSSDEEVSESSSAISSHEDDTSISTPANSSNSSPLALSDILWPTILERADRVARREYLQEEASTKAASAMYLLFREKGYQAIIR